MTLKNLPCNVNYWNATRAVPQYYYDNTLTWARNIDCTDRQWLLRICFSALYHLWVIKTQKGNYAKMVCSVIAAAYHIKGLYKIREYTNKKTWKTTWMEYSCFQNCPLSSWSGGKVFEKAVRLFKNKTKQNVFIKLSPWPQAGMPPRTL